MRDDLERRDLLQRAQVERKYAPNRERSGGGGETLAGLRHAKFSTHSGNKPRPPSVFYDVAGKNRFSPRSTGTVRTERSRGGEYHEV
jgi:hypothetical protein